MPTMGSLFDGIGGFPLAAIHNGITPLWASEIEPFPIETEERDEIYMALRGILDALPGDTLQKDSLIEKFDELRDF